MNLPNYFLADLPVEAELSPTIVTEACRTLKRNREQYLAQRRTDNLIQVLSHLAGEWLLPDYPFRKAALEEGPAATGFSRETLEVGLNGFFRELTRQNLEVLVEQDLGHAKRLDEMVASDLEQKGNRAALAVAPELLVHIAAGNLPNPTLMSITLGLLTRSAQFVKCATGTSFIPRLFAHSLYELDRKLGACLEVAEWRRPQGPVVDSPIVELPESRRGAGSSEVPSDRMKGGKVPNGVHSVDLPGIALNKALFAEADCVTATGDDDTLFTIRQQLPAKTRFLGYGHRVSFIFIAAGALSGLNSRKVAERAAQDVAAWDQLGCLSPHVIYVENGGGMTPLQFAEALAQETERREKLEPRGKLSVEASAGIASRRSFYELRAAHSDDTSLWTSKESTSWTVVFEADVRFQTSCLNRFVYVKGVGSLTEALQAADSVREKVSTVGLAAPIDKAQALATELARWGVGRACPLGRMQHPPLTWRHDGRPALGDLILWTDFELE